MDEGVYFGFRVPEIVWEEQVGVAALLKVVSRNPELVERWLYDPAGNLLDYGYRGSRPRGEGLNGGRAGTHQVTVAVPIENCVHAVAVPPGGSPGHQAVRRSGFRGARRGGATSSRYGRRRSCSGGTTSGSHRRRAMQVSSSA
jgi:hypothetical protein